MDVIKQSTAILNASTSSEVFHILKSWVIKLTSDPSPLIFILSTKKAAYLQVEESGFTEICRPLDFIFDEDRHLIGKRNLGDIIGFIEIGHGVLKIDADKKLLVSGGLKSLYERLYLANYFDNIRRPLDFTNRDAYFNDTATLLSEALSMEMVAIRRLNQNGDLQCLAFYREREQHCVNFEKDNMPPPFAELLLNVKSALEGEHGGIEHVLPSFEEVIDKPNDPRYQFLKNDPVLNKVKIFLIFPIILDEEIFGVISCSTTAPLHFTNIEQMAIETTMQIISVSISNYYRYHEAKLLESEKTDQLFDLTALEIAQATRHELSNIQMDQKLQYMQIERHLRGYKNQQVQDGLTQLRDLIERLSESINKFRYSTPNGSTPELKQTSLQKIWENTVALVKPRLDKAKITALYSGGDVRDMFYTDWLHSAFINLLFNSIDAFNGNARPKQNRIIKLVAQKVGEHAHEYILDYSDNAGGISFNRLHIPTTIRELNPNLSNEQLLFQPKVTSKKDKVGGGWGLYLVRRAIAMHKGSVYLFANNNEGCTFRISLRKGLVETTNK